jgi:hypothetical protein
MTYLIHKMLKKFTKFILMSHTSLEWVLNC